jgi:hypothetical protein
MLPKFLVQIVRECDNSAVLGIYAKILKLILKIWSCDLDPAGTLLSGCCEHGDEPTSYTEGEESLDNSSALLACQEHLSCMKMAS